MDESSCWVNRCTPRQPPTHYPPATLPESTTQILLDPYAKHVKGRSVFGLRDEFEQYKGKVRRQWRLRWCLQCGALHRLGTGLQHCWRLLTALLLLLLLVLAPARVLPAALHQTPATEPTLPPHLPRHLLCFLMSRRAASSGAPLTLSPSPLTGGAATRGPASRSRTSSLRSCPCACSQVGGARVAGGREGAADLPERTCSQPSRVLLYCFQRLVGLAGGLSWGLGSFAAPGAPVGCTRGSFAAPTGAANWCMPQLSTSPILPLRAAGESSGLPAGQRGTYAGVAAKVDHLKELGVNAGKLCRGRGGRVPAEGGATTCVSHLQLLGVPGASSRPAHECLPSDLPPACPTPSKAPCGCPSIDQTCRTPSHCHLQWSCCPSLSTTSWSSSAGACCTPTSPLVHAVVAVPLLLLACMQWRLHPYLS